VLYPFTVNVPAEAGPDRNLNVVDVTDPDETRPQRKIKNEEFACKHAMLAAANAFDVASLKSAAVTVLMFDELACIAANTKIELVALCGVIVALAN